MHHDARQKHAARPCAGAPVGARARAKPDRRPRTDPPFVLAGPRRRPHDDVAGPMVATAESAPHVPPAG